MRLYSNAGAQNLSAIYNIGAPAFSIISQNAFYWLQAQKARKHYDTVSMHAA